MADRIEREIEEILRKIDNFVPERARRPARRMGRPFTAAQGWFAHRLARISLRQVMMWSLLTLAVAFFLKAIPFFFWIMIASLVVFATAFLLSRLGGGKTSTAPKRWRGQELDLSAPRWPERLKAWIKGRRRP